MKTLFSKYLLIIFLIPIGFGCSRNNKNQPIDKVDYDGFVILSDSLSKYRETRLIDETTFNNFRSDANTIVLDTRSKEAYDEIHIEGATHLNFSDFTEKKLRKIIPSKKTRILIYCNNNFDSKIPSLYDKSIRLALNIPTFINLYGYGYKNIYELNGYLKEENTKIPLMTNNKN